MSNNTNAPTGFWENIRSISTGTKVVAVLFLLVVAVSAGIPFPAAVLIIGIVWVVMGVAYRDYQKRIQVQEMRETEGRSIQQHPQQNTRTSNATAGKDSGESHIQRIDPEDIKVDFEKVAGNHEAKRNLQETIDFLKSPEKYHDIGAKIPKGTMLYGPPGTGKTMLAKAVAKEADVPFFATSGSEFVQKYVGTGAERIRSLFAAARRAAPAIVFIDEIDSLGRSRSGSKSGSHEYDHALTQLLSEMDGFKNEGYDIIVIGATNRLDILDSALLRPGRFDRQIEVDRPDFTARKAILGVHAKGKKIDKGVDLDVLARRTPGMVGAELESLINEALILAVRRSAKKANMEDFESAIDRVIAGSERETLIISDEEKRMIAFHEMGHALVGEHYGKPVHKITAIPRGKSLGHTQALPDVEKHLHLEEELLGQMAFSMGGRVAEELAFDGIKSSGAADDFNKARDIAEKMVKQLGMSSLGNIVFPSGNGYYGMEYSQSTLEKIETEIEAIVNKAYDMARDVLKEKNGLLQACAERLLEVETIEREEFLGLIEEHSGSSDKLAYA